MLPDPAGELTSALSDPLAGFKGLTSSWKEGGKWGGSGRGRKKEEERGRRRETPMSRIGKIKRWEPYLQTHRLGRGSTVIKGPHCQRNDPTNSVKALKEGRVLRIRLQSHQVHPTMLTIIQLCSIKQKHTDTQFLSLLQYSMPWAEWTQGNMW